MIKCCPECESSDIEPVQPESFTGPELSDGQNYRCENCQDHFEKPMYRQAQSSRDAGRSGLTKELVEADPEDWP